MSSIDPESIPVDPYLPMAEHSEIHTPPPTTSKDAVERHTDSQQHDPKANQSPRQKELKEDSEAALKKLEYLKQVARTTPNNISSPELQALIKTEKKIETVRTKYSIIVQKAEKMNEQLETYQTEMQKAVDILNAAIKDFNKTPATGTPALQSAIEAYQAATSAATKNYVRESGIFNALVKTIPEINAQLASLGLPKLSPIPSLAPPPISTASGAYAPPSIAQSPIPSLLPIPPRTPITSITPPPSKAQAIELSLGSAIMALLNSIAQPMNIQKHIDRQV